VLADLGLVTVPKIRLGTQRWDFQFHAKSTVAGDDLDWDWIALVPADEGSGRLAAPSVGNAILSGGSVVITHDTAQIKGSSANYWDGAYEGDYLRIPPRARRVARSRSSRSDRPDHDRREPDRHDRRRGEHRRGHRDADLPAPLPQRPGALGARGGRPSHAQRHAR
jgi:hypothetical protein